MELVTTDSLVLLRSGGGTKRSWSKWTEENLVKLLILQLWSGLSLSEMKCHVPQQVEQYRAPDAEAASIICVT